MDKYVKYVLCVLLWACMVSISAQSSDTSTKKIVINVNGLQDGQPLLPSLTSVVQNTASAEISKSGKYVVVDRSENHLEQMKRELQNGAVPIGQMERPQYVCLITVTIENSILHSILFLKVSITDVETGIMVGISQSQYVDDDCTSIDQIVYHLKEAINSMLFYNSF